MKCEQIREILETLAPVAMACEWDNPGFQVCRWEKEINSIYLAVDATDEVIAEAKELKADMILTHHPLIFGGIKNILTSDFIGRRIYGLAQQDMVYCAMHTNFDICVMADLASDYLELMETEPLEVTGEWQGKSCGIGKVGMLPEVISLGDCGRIVKSRFQTEAVKVFGDTSRMVQRAAICPGSGKSEVDEAIAKGAQVLITGDIDHHTGIDAAARGLSILDAGHYGLEHIFVTYMAEYFKERLPELNIYSQKLQSPFSYIA